MKLVIKEDVRLVAFEGKCLHFSQGQELRLAEYQDDEGPSKGSEDQTVWVENPETGTRIEVSIRIFTVESLALAKFDPS